MGSDDDMDVGPDEREPGSDVESTAGRMRHDLQRILIPAPMSAKPLTGYLCPRPHLMGGERIQVTAHVTEHSEIVERWQLSDEDVRWYRLEAYKKKWVTLKVDTRTPVF